MTGADQAASAGGAPRADEAAFAALGGGGRQDRLGLRVVVQILRRCLPLLRDVRGHLLALVGGFAGAAILLLPVVLLLLDVVWTRILNGEPLTPLEAQLFGVDPATATGVPALPPTLRHALAEKVVWLGVSLALVLVPAVLALFYYQTWILQRINQLLRMRLFERLQTLSLRFHAESRVGDALYRIHQDSATVTQLIELLILAPLFASARFVFSLVVVAVFDPGLALLLLAIWPPALVGGAFVAKRLRRRFRAAREAQSDLTSRIQETLAGIRVLKAYGAEAREQARFERDSRAAFAVAYTARSLFAVFGVAVFWLVGAAVLASTAAVTLATRDGASVFAARLFASAGFTAWNLGLYNFFKERFGEGAGGLVALFRTWARVQDLAIGLDRVFEVLDLEPEVKDAPDAVAVPPFVRGVAFRGVGFSYAPGRPVLHDVSFEARPGTITAIVGPTGSGKSTLVALLLRLFDPDAGSIELDGVDLRRLRLDALRAHVAIALQENLLFGTTVRENLRYAAPAASDAELRRAAAVACVDEFVETLPDGYDTLLGERGSKLSTGQRQRLSIARAVLKDAPILVLDEPTASLDAETELRVLRRLAEWGRGRAIFLITHRLSTVRRADRVLVLQEGRLVEQGSHDELVARPGGVYRRLVEREREPAEEGARRLATGSAS
ncbi:MAG TPA: ABC transporter ATP-binding protein [Myxococcota bacterium]|jgi:ABC-type multidrug transport system fused ATPase/permease subunit|nr:ABC transporter ATP-binding protein [Myxococcota bacterium]